ncbi:hypothetical protein DP117_21200 [Brasilonema sp. UFV-L1]|nr:hypothetical protein [Brasilonema sp. UFV-L1]
MNKLFTFTAFFLEFLILKDSTQLKLMEFFKLENKLPVFISITTLGLTHALLKTVGCDCFPPVAADYDYVVRA